MQLRKRTTRKVKATLDMTPMIDVTFQLIIFFLLSSTFVVQSSVPVDLSETEGAVTHEKKQLTITLQTGPGGFDGQGGVYADEAEIKSWSELRGILQALRERDAEAQLLIRPDRAVPTERLLRVLGIANVCGITQYSIAAREIAPDMLTGPDEPASGTPAPESANPASPGQGP